MYDAVRPITLVHFNLALANVRQETQVAPVPYTPLRAHETLRYLVCRLLLEKKKNHYTIPM